MLSTSVELIADDLRRYGEDPTANWVLTCSDDELVRVCSVAEWLLYYGPGRKSGSMMIAKACALAAVYVREGAPRELARRTRKPSGPLTRAEQCRSDSGRRPDVDAQARAGREHGFLYGVGSDAQNYWRASD